MPENIISLILILDYEIGQLLNILISESLENNCKKMGLIWTMDTKFLFLEALQGSFVTV